MRKLLGFTSIAALALALFAGSFMTTKVYAGKSTTASSTAQSIMANVRGTGTFAVNQVNTYRYDEAGAAAYFSNTQTSGPVASCSGSPTNCYPSNQPAAPGAPAPDNAQVSGQQNNSAVSTNQCTFLDGGTLIGHGYSQAVTIKGLNGGGNWTFTWGYTVAPVGSFDIDFDNSNGVQVAAFTNWPLYNSTGDGLAHVNLHAEIAGESVLISKQYPTGKYSFSLRADDSSNRVTGVVITVDGIPYPMDTSLVENAPGALAGDPGALDFAYTENAGRNPLTPNSASALLINGDARSILNGVIGTDTFTGNDNGGSNGQALAMAVGSPVEVGLAPGDHTIVLTGTVKGNSALTPDQTISVTQTIHVVTPGCGVGNNQ